MRFTQQKGDTAVAQAAATFTQMGYDVSIPFTESAAYDLIIDVNGSLKKIQVRFSSTSEVDLRRIHSNSKGYVIKKTKRDAYDWLYILTANGSEYIIPKCLYGRRSIKPTRQYLVDKKRGILVK